MTRCVNVANSNVYIKRFDFVAVFPWIFGLLVGSFLSYRFGGYFASLMRMAVLCPVSIVASLTSVFFPFFISVYFVRYHRRLWLYIVCFLKAVSFSASFAALSAVFGTAGWLIRALFLFSDTISCFLLMNLCLRIRQQESNFNSALLQCTVCLVTVFIDYMYISPFLRGLF